MLLEKDTLELLPAAVKALEEGFASLPSIEAKIPGQEGMAAIIQQVVGRLRDNYPYFHPLYAGQMLKPPHPIARAAYALATWINPNNHALDGGRASSAMEKEAVAELAAMFGWQTHLGHPPAAAPWRILRRSGWRGGFIREKRLPPPRKPTTRTNA